MLACQQNMPAPSKVKPVVMVDVTGLHAPTTGVRDAPIVGVRVGVNVATPGVNVRVGVLVTAPGVDVRVGVLVAAGVLVRVDVNPVVGVRVGVLVIPKVGVRVGVAVIAAVVDVRVGEAPTIWVGVFVFTTAVLVGVLAGVPPGSRP